MKIKYLEAKYKIKGKIPKKIIKILKETLNKKGATLAIYSSIQFLDKIEETKQLLQKEKYDIITSTPFRVTYQSQILGCDSYIDSLNLKTNTKKIDGILYIGDGMFHPQALIIAQEQEKQIKPVFIINPIRESIEILDENYITKYLRKKRANLAKFHLSDIIGVFISSKWGQEYKNSALKLKEIYKDKQFYYFIGDNFIEEEMDNFTYIQCWVNTACPRIGQDDILRHKKAIINIKDVWK